MKRSTAGSAWRTMSRKTTAARTAAPAAKPAAQTEPGITVAQLRAAFALLVKKANGVTDDHVKAAIAPVTLKSPWITKAQIAALLSNVELQASGCWRWTGPVTDADLPKFGFCPEGTARLAPKVPMAHRTAWAWFRGLLLPYPYWKVDQKCGHKRCLNPAHLRQTRVPQKGELALSSARLTMIFEHVTRTAPKDCWYWTGSINASGYPVHRFDDGSLRGVESVLYDWFVGFGVGQAPHEFEAGRNRAAQLSEKPLLFHRCLVRACVNPAHMNLVPRGQRWTAEHIAAGAEKDLPTERTDV